MNLLHNTVAALLLAGVVPIVPQPPTGPPPDERAIEIARRTLDAIESGWAIPRYDEARRVRAAVNLRGGGSGDPLGLTANVIADRAGGRYRIDAAGDVGPLTLIVDRQRAVLHVPALGQYARRPGGALASGDALSRSLSAEIAAARARLAAGNVGLIFGGEETIDGAATYRLAETPAPGETATYWIDTGTYLPRRVSLDRPGRRDVRVDLAYAGGPRPSRIDVSLQGERDVRAAVRPGYDGTGRVSRLHAETRVAGGGVTTIDINLDWSPAVSAELFRFTPPSGAQEVPFEQLASGVLFAAAGRLGSLLPLVTGWL